MQVGLSFAVSKQKVRSRIINLIIGSSYYYTLIAFSPTERLSVKGQLFKKTSLLRCLSVGNVIDDKLEIDNLFLAIFRKAKMRSGYNSNLNLFLFKMATCLAFLLRLADVPAFLPLSFITACSNDERIVRS